MNCEAETTKVMTTGAEGSRRFAGAHLGCVAVAESCSALRRSLANGPSAGRSLVFLVGLLAIVLATTAPVSASTASKAVARGNAAWTEKRYDEALELYAEASVDSPESAEIAFNQGTVHYRREEFAEAIEFFQDAAVKTRDTGLEAKCKYNLGNTAFRQAERQRDGDLQKALESCERSVRHYQAALKLSPEMSEAAENIEVVRLTMKAILDEIKKREEEARQQQQEQQELQEKLKELIEKQEEQLERNKAVSDEQRQQGDTTDSWDQVKELADDQRQLRDETRELSEELEQQAAAQRPQQQPQPPQAPPQPGPGESPFQKARQHVDRAAERQGEAGQELAANQPEAAQPKQEQAAEDLRKALDALSGDPQASPDQSGSQQQESGNSEPEQDQQQPQPPDDQQQNSGEQDEPSPSQPQPQPEPDEQEAQSAVPLPDEARDILSEEKENRERRRVPTGGYRPVDRDW